MTRAPRPKEAYAAITRDERVGGRRLVVLDGMLDVAAARSVHEFAVGLPYRLNDVDSDETAYSRHWKHEISRSEAETPGIYASMVALARRLFAGRRLQPRRIHYNLHQYGDVQFPHRDTDGDGVTVLLYVNHVWDPSWMGETIFYERADEPTLAVLPRPGRMVVFEGAIIHRAGVAQRECFSPRISLALKLDATALPERTSRSKRRPRARG